MNRSRLQSSNYRAPGPTRQVFEDDFNIAITRFFGEEVISAHTLAANEEKLSEFQEWYFFDYLTSSGETIIDIFAREEGPKLPERERELLSS